MDLHIKTISNLLLIACIMTVSACSNEQPPTELSVTKAKQNIEMIAMDLVPVKTGQLELSRHFTGTIQAIYQSSIQAQVSATVLKINTDVGQYVKKDQVLIELNQQDNAARLAQAKANLASAKAQAELNKSVMLRKNNLLQQGFISKLEYEQSQLDYRAQVENVKAQQANVDIAQKAAQDTIIKSPINGYITKRNVEIGQTVSLGQTLFEIVDPSQLEIKANIAVNEQDFLNIGQNINFSIQGHPKQYQATVSRISPVADQVSRNLEFYAKPISNIQQLSIGSFIEGQLIGSHHTQGQIIPLSSIQSLKNKPFVWVIRDLKINKIFIEVLETDQKQEVAVISGLQPQDQVSLVKFNDQNIGQDVRIQS